MDLKKRPSLLVIILLLWCGFAIAQDEDAESEYLEFETPSAQYEDEEPPATKLNKESWEELTREMDYGKRKKKEEEEEEEETGELEGDGELEEDDGSSSLWNFESKTLGAVVMAIIILALCLLIIYLISKHVKEKDIKVSTEENVVYSIEEAEENLPESDLERLLRLALESGEFRAAIRIYYLMIIQQLTLKQFIEWEREKTNYDYLLEMSSGKHYQPFSQLTLAYEVVWYGDADVDEVIYQQLSPSFSKFIDVLKNG